MNIFVSEIDNKYRYLYKITNIITNQYYYGIHKTSNLDDGYMGSGKRLKIAQKELGLENFKKEYIEFFKDDQSLMEAEKQMVTEDVLNDPLCYNIIKGGGPCKGTFPIINIYTGEKKAKPYNEEYDTTEWVHITTGRKRIHKFINGICINKYIYEKYIPQYLNDGCILGGLSCVLGKIKINNGKKVKYIFKDNIQSYLDNGWKIGGLPIACKGNIRIINSSKTVEKFIKPHELEKYIAEGWTRGNLHSGRIHIFRNENENKMVHKHELENYLNNGWKLGSTNHSIIGRIKIIKDNKCITIFPSEFEKYAAEGWVKGSKKTTEGKIVISKDGNNKFIYPDDLDKYLSEGWVKGKCKKDTSKLTNQQYIDILFNKIN